MLAFGLVGKESLHLLNSSIVGTHNKAMVVYVQDQVLALRVHTKE